MSTVLLLVLDVAGIFGVLLLAASLVLSASRNLRPWAIAVLCGGVLGAGLGVGLLVLFGTMRGVGQEVTISDVTAILAIAGFGMGGSFGAAVRYLVGLLQTNDARLKGGSR
jgi:hypothetical protein